MTDPITVPEASEIAGVSKTYVLRMCNAGKIGAEKRGGTWLIPRAHFDEFLKRDRKPGPKPKPATKGAKPNAK